MKLFSLLLLSGFLSVSCSHKSKSCCSKDSCDKEKKSCCMEKKDDCKDGSCAKKTEEKKQ